MLCSGHKDSAGVVLAILALILGGHMRRQHRSTQSASDIAEHERWGLSTAMSADSTRNYWVDLAALMDDIRPEGADMKSLAPPRQQRTQWRTCCRQSASTCRGRRRSTLQQRRSYSGVHGNVSEC
jgi:hypothetical protein